MSAGRGRVRPLVAVVLVVAATVLAGCADDEPAAVTTTTTSAARTTTTRPLPDRVSRVAQAVVPSVEVYGLPIAPDPFVTLTNPTELGGALVFLEKAAHPDVDDWLEVFLPVPPVGSSGWVHADDVTVTEHQFSIELHRKGHRIVVRNGEEVILFEPLGVGPDAPPAGTRAYIKELLQPPVAEGPYGAFVYGLSGAINHVSSFASGEGIVGIHGTDQPETVGTDTARGCFSLRDDILRKLTEQLPLGVPVKVVA